MNIITFKVIVKHVIITILWIKFNFAQLYVRTHFRLVDKIKNFLRKLCIFFNNNNKKKIWEEYTFKISKLVKI